MPLTRREAAGALAGLAPLGRKAAGVDREQNVVWAHPVDAGTSAETVAHFVELCRRAHIDTLVMLVKHTTGAIFWKSRRFPQTIAKGYENCDLIEHLARECRSRGIRLRAWLCGYAEGGVGAAYREHPEWAALNEAGSTKLSEVGEGGQSSGAVAMCPARRPGYTDQWLLPMIEEVACNYALDGIHHDYVRYTGDIAPDSYCFCDYCLENLPLHAMLHWVSGPRERQRMEAIRPRLEANWGGTPDMLPAGWDRMDRREKADCFYCGGTLAGGPRDLCCCFYQYRVDLVNRFVREAQELVMAVNPKMEISAAVFKNPIQCARYIEQKGDDWTPWVEIFRPMSYRSRSLGDFDSYPAHLTEITARQKEWIEYGRPLYAGIASTHPYKEEPQASPKRYPPEKLARAIRAARAAKPAGMLVFSAAGLTAENPWPMLEEEFES